jgi:2-keto-3-deoxy-L-rhamnonate aldolase RhmA
VIAGWLVGKVLDAGAMDVICPMINTGRTNW